MVNVVDVPITHIDLPEILQQAIAQKQVMEQQSLQKQYELDKARKEAEITIANAEAQALSIKLQSDALQKSPAGFCKNLQREFRRQPIVDTSKYE